MRHVEVMVAIVNHDKVVGVVVVVVVVMVVSIHDLSLS